MMFGTIFFLSILALVYAALLPSKWRGWALLGISVIAIYVLQPALPIRYSAFILPTAMLVLIVASWWVTRQRDSDSSAQGVQLNAPTQIDSGTDSKVSDSFSPSPRLRGRGGWGVRGLTRDDLLSVVLIIALVITLSLLRFIDANFRLVATTPPPPLTVIISLVIVSVVGTGLTLVSGKAPHKRTLTGMILLIVALFVVFKAQPLADALSYWLRSQSRQDTSLASFIDLGWIGFSYVAFRLIHTLRDRQTGILPDLSLREYVSYVIFFPAFSAGPIDRAERFVEDYRVLPTRIGLDAGRFSLGVTRIMVGLLKKFIIADLLALGMALNPINALQTDSTVGMWVLLYGYGWRLFFDFSGYSDIAIGIGILYGITLPENFNRPYLKATLTSFWQSWHMTLSSWARVYVFSPLSRALLMRKPKPSSTLIVLLSQVATMTVIGLWHGITLNFVIWGLWHGVGLFAHKQWSDRTRKWYRELNDKPRKKRFWTAFSWFVTFHYVMLGWVWFLLPDVRQSLRVFGILFGGGL